MGVVRFAVSEKWKNTGAIVAGRSFAPSVAASPMVSCQKTCRLASAGGAGSREARSYEKSSFDLEVINRRVSPCGFFFEPAEEECGNG